MGKRVNFDRKSRIAFPQSNSVDSGCDMCGSNDYHGREECQAISLARIAEALEIIARKQQ
jgi:hypothetical protein